MEEAKARFLVVGAYAVGVHRHPRATKDLDVWIEASAANAPRVMHALRSFGAPLMRPRSRRTFAVPSSVSRRYSRISALPPDPRISRTSRRSIACFD